MIRNNNKWNNFNNCTVMELKKIFKILKELEIELLKIL